VSAGGVSDRPENRPAEVAGGLPARCLELLGPFDGALAVAAPRAPRMASALALRAVPSGGAAGAAIVIFLGTRGDSRERRAVLAELGRRLSIGAPLVLVDHNQPRAWWRRALGVVRLAVAGLGPARARYPAARELAAAGFRVERLRLACGERVQLVAARRRADRRDG
jgi:hypothetical protein